MQVLFGSSEVTQDLLACQGIPHIQVLDVGGLASASGKVVLRFVSLDQHAQLERDFPHIEFFPSLTERRKLAALARSMNVADVLLDVPELSFHFASLRQTYFAAYPSRFDGGVHDGHKFYNDSASEMNRTLDKHTAFYPFWFIQVAPQLGGTFKVIAVQDGVDGVIASTMSLTAFYEVLASKIDGTCCR